MTFPGPGTVVRANEAHELVHAVQDPVVREALRFCLARAVLSLDSGMHEPPRPFDLEAFARVLLDVFSKRQILERILAGQSIAQATGLDI